MPGNENLLTHLFIAQGTSQFPKTPRAFPGGNRYGNAFPRPGKPSGFAGQ